MATPALAAWLAGSVEPLRRAGREGYAPSELERRRLAIVGSGGLCSRPCSSRGRVLGGGRRGRACRGRLGGDVAARPLPPRGRARACPRSRPRSPTHSRPGDRCAGRWPPLPPRSTALPPPRWHASPRTSHWGSPPPRRSARLRGRLHSQRVDVFCSALLSQQIAGGDLATLLRRYAEATAEHERVAEDARAATAQARFTGPARGRPAGRGGVVRRVARAGIHRRACSPRARRWSCWRSPAAFQLVGFLAIRRFGSVVE